MVAIWLLEGGREGERGGGREGGRERGGGREGGREEFCYCERMICCLHPEYV